MKPQGDKSFRRIECYEKGRVDGMVVLWPSHNSYEKYSTPYNCFFAPGDKIMLFDKRRFTDEQCSRMPDIWKHKEVFENKNYRLATVIGPSGGSYIVCDYKSHDINSRQGFNEEIKFKYDDTGEEVDSYCIYWLIIGRVVDEDYYDKSTNKIYNKSQRVLWPSMGCTKRNVRLRCYDKMGGFCDYLFEEGKDYQFDWDIEREHLTVHTDKGELLISWDQRRYWFD